MLARLREEEGKIAEASETLQEVAIETFGSMEKREKAEFLLEQVRVKTRGRSSECGWAGGVCALAMA
jgi:hypothetical protein